MAHTSFELTINKALDPLRVEAIKAALAAENPGAEVSATVVEPKLTYRVWRDPDPDNPRRWDNVGTMHCAHQRYSFGDSKATTPWVDGDYRAKVLRDDVLVWLPIYMYDHSGITVSHTPFSCQWDSGLLGWHYVTKKAAAENRPDLQGSELIERCKDAMADELKTYDEYLQGDVWGYTITDEEGDEVDSCGGFYGDDIDQNGLLDSAGMEHFKGLLAAWSERE